jgi:hypothetical protein
MFAVNGRRKRNPFSTSLVAAVAVAVAVAAAAVDIHDCLYVCIDDGGDGGGGYTDGSLTAGMSVFCFVYFFCKFSFLLQTTHPSHYMHRTRQTYYNCK